MVTLTLATLGNSAILFIRDVLRNSITDTQGTPRAGSAWIWKSMPAERDFDPPIVVIRLEESTYDRISIGYKRGHPELRFDIRVWASKIADRDTVADEIVDVLTTKTSTDGTTTIQESYLVYQDITQSEEDGYIGDKPDVMRIKRIRIRYKYVGV